MRPRTTAEYQAGNERALADTARIEELVAKMLNLARVENGAASTAGDSQTDLNQCVAQTLAELESFAFVRQVELKVHDLPPGACPVPLSAEDCKLIVSNLVMNAIQHSPVRAQVALAVALREHAVELTVQDGGDGIDPAALPHVFDRFYRGDPSRARATGGAGLGLAICKAAVEKAGGCITLSSTPGKGTTATVRLPKA
jgi:signal transduction histidine kinase